MQKFFCLATPFFTQHTLSTIGLLTGAYTGIFPDREAFKLIPVIPVGTASVERSFSAMKLIKTRLITDGNLGRLMRISMKGRSLPAVDF